MVRIAVAQMTSVADKAANLASCLALVAEAHAGGARMLFLPEAFDYIAPSAASAREWAEPLDGDFLGRLAQAAREHDMWLSLGGFHERVAGEEVGAGIAADRKFQPDKKFDMKKGDTVRT